MLAITRDTRNHAPRQRSEAMAVITDDASNYIHPDEWREVIQIHEKLVQIDGES